MGNYLSANTDTELVQAYQAGDPLAFERLVAKHRPTIVAHAARVLGDPDAAESAAQEVLLRLYKSIDGFRADARFSTWLYRVTMNVCFTSLDKERREREKINAFGWVDTQPVQAASSLREFNQMIGTVGADEQQILVMRFVYDWELRDIATVMNIGISAAKMRLYRALDKIRQYYSGANFSQIA